MVSESQLVVENSDVSFAIHKEQTADGAVYMAFKKLKGRDNKDEKIATNEYFAHPMTKGNGMKMEEDFDLKHSLSVENLEERFGATLMIDENPEDDEFEEEVEAKPKRRKKLQDVS
jgi:hypothetical protein